MRAYHLHASTDVSDESLRKEGSLAGGNQHCENAELGRREEKASAFMRARVAVRLVRAFCVHVRSRACYFRVVHPALSAFLV